MAPNFRLASSTVLHLRTNYILECSSTCHDTLRDSVDGDVQDTTAHARAIYLFYAWRLDAAYRLVKVTTAGNRTVVSIHLYGRYAGGANSGSLFEVQTAKRFLLVAGSRSGYGKPFK